jgi:hypothetical protein|tara:strand:- start:354 stop:854 length:501 start_codon:yes stop_codon:yes gene_type:complete
MKKGLLAIFSLAIIITACNDSSESAVIVNDKSVADKAGEEYSVVTIEDMVMSDTSSVVIDSVARVDYENDLSLEIKEIEEEIENPISEDCKMFLEEYADGIKSFARITEKVAANPEDIGIQIQMSSASEDINAWATMPQMFQCSQNEAFQKQIEILNEKKDRLLEI